MQEPMLGSGGSYVINPETHELVLQERTVNPGTEDDTEDAAKDTAVAAVETPVEKPKATTKSKADASAEDKG